MNGAEKDPLQPFPHSPPMTDQPTPRSTYSDYPGAGRGWKPGTKPSPILVRAADRVYAACERAIRSGRIDARSEIGDAVLDYRDERDEMERRMALVNDLDSCITIPTAEELGSARFLLDETRLRVKRLCGELMAEVDTAEPSIANKQTTVLHARHQLAALAQQLDEAVKDHSQALLGQEQGS